jgi:hypothetical protein
MIKSDIKTVWTIMNDFDDYVNWNPFIVNVKIKKLDSIQRMKFYLKWYDGRKGTSLEEMIHSKEKENGIYELKYKYASIVSKIGLVKAERIQTIQEYNGEVKYYTIKEYTGLLKNLVPVNSVAKGFEIQAMALKEKAEKYLTDL